MYLFIIMGNTLFEIKINKDSIKNKLNYVNKLQVNIK